MISKKEYQQAWYRDNAKRLKQKAKLNRLTNPERATEASKRWAAANPIRRQEILLKSKLKIKYGITTEIYFKFLTQQGGVCAICKLPETKTLPQNKSIARLAVDHDHTTGQIRGLLCKSCNIAIGSMKDSSDRLLAAAQYLQERNK